MMKRALHAALVVATFCSLAACQRPAEQEAATPAPEPSAAAATPEAAGAAASTAAPAPPVDLEALAKRIVTQSAGVKEGEAVLITRHGRPVAKLSPVNKSGDPLSPRRLSGRELVARMEALHASIRAHNPEAADLTWEDLKEDARR